MIGPDAYSDGWARETAPRDLLPVAENLREVDREEVLKVGEEPLDALVTGYLQSDYCWTLVNPLTDKPLGIVGIAPSGEPDIGIIWALFTDGIAAHRGRLLRAATRWIDEAHDAYPVLYNAIWSGNSMHLQWARALGFKELDHVPVGNSVFIPIARVRQNV